MKVLSVVAVGFATLYGLLCFELLYKLSPPTVDTVFAVSQYSLQQFAVVVYSVGTLMFLWVAWTLWNLKRWRLG